MWNSHQRRRLACEKKILERELPQFRFYDSTGDTYVQGDVFLPSAGLTLTLRCVIGRWFPDTMPEVYVVRPVTLWKYRRRSTINAEGCSHSYHTLSNGPSGVVQICTSGQWHSSVSLTGLLLKALFWCRCYEEHLRTGKPICDFCR